MAGLIRIKRSFTATAAPTSLQPGEMAVNVTDKRIWFGNAANAPVEFILGGGGGGGSGATGLSVINFGAGDDMASVTITGQTGITGTSYVTANLAAIATAEHSADEHVIEEIDVYAGNIVVGTGFTIYARTRNFKLTGNWTVAWQWR